MKRIIIVLISIVSLFSIFSKSISSNRLQIDYSVPSYGKDPGAAPETVEERLEALQTSVEMRYSKEVQNHIETYMKNGRKQLTSLLALSSYYMPIFEEALKDAGLPDELKYLPVIESQLDALATSPAGAGGLWQFMPIAAKGYDMKINSSIDERRDPYLSSERACRMFKDLYKKFGDWTLVIAAYNCGPGNLQKALRRAGGDPSKHNFWSIKQYLPAQTRKYIPKFIAMVYLMNYYQDHDIPEVKVETSVATEVISVSEKMSLSKMAPMLNMSVSELKKHNPHFKGDIIPATAARPCNLIVPAAKAQAYRDRMAAAEDDLTS